MGKKKKLKKFCESWNTLLYVFTLKSNWWQDEDIIPFGVCVVLSSSCLCVCVFGKFRTFGCTKDNGIYLPWPTYKLRQEGNNLIGAKIHLKTEKCREGCHHITTQWGEIKAHTHRSVQDNQLATLLPEFKIVSHQKFQKPLVCRSRLT